MTLAWRDLPFGPALRQPDQRSCGPSCAVLARMAVDQEYARSTAPRFAEEVLETHRRITGPRDAAGAIQPPWPRALGTPPWALARQLGVAAGPTYRWRVARLGRARAFQRVLDGVRGRHPVGLYVGTTWLPRHVVLALDEVDGALEVYDPARGRVERVSRESFAGAALGLSGWDMPWFTVTPGP